MTGNAEAIVAFREQTLKTLPVQERTGLQLSCSLVTLGCTYPGATPEQGCANSPGAPVPVRVWVEQALTFSMSCMLQHPAPSSGIQALGLGAQNALFFLDSPHCLLSLCMPLVLPRAAGHHGAPKGAAPAQRKLACLP